MTTDILVRDRPPIRLSADLIGALAGVTPIVMFGAFTLVSGWYGAPFELGCAMAAVGLGAGLAGWIVGGHLSRSILGALLVYGPVAWFVVLPFNVVGSVWEGVRSGWAFDPFGLIVAAAGFALYGVISAAYLSVFLIPFGAGWTVTFLLLRRTLLR